MYDIFNKIRLKIENQQNNRLRTPSILNLNPSSQVCYDNNGKQIGSCLRMVWLQKNDIKPSNNVSSVNLTSVSGNWFEDWFLSELKNIGAYQDSSFSITDPQRFVKGIVDCSFNTEEGLEAGEIKSYDGSNYQNSSAILGNMSTPPKPRIKHLLQTFRYSLILKDKIKRNNLFYIDRAGSAWFKNKQFVIDTVELNGKLHPKISTIWKDEYYEYIDINISNVNIYKAEEDLLNCFYENKAPSKGFIEVFQDSEIESKYSLKEIPEYLYKKYKKDSSNTIGDSACRYCPYANGVCSSYG